MTLKEQIQKDRITAMKEGNKEKRLVLSTLIGELDRIDKNPTDAQVIKKVKSLIDSNVECGNVSENQFLEGYLPKTLSEQELDTLIVNHINGMNLSGMNIVIGIWNYPNLYYLINPRAAKPAKKAHVVL